MSLRSERDSSQYIEIINCAHVRYVICPRFYFTNEIVTNYRNCRTKAAGENVVKVDIHNTFRPASVLRQEDDDIG